jgi:hypothetical protein
VAGEDQQELSLGILMNRTILAREVACRRNLGGVGQRPKFRKSTIGYDPSQGRKSPAPLSEVHPRIAGLVEGVWRRAAYTAMPPTIVGRFSMDGSPGEM